MKLKDLKLKLANGEPNKKLAEEYFEAEMMSNRLEIRLTDALMEAIDIDPDTGIWPCDDITFDHYDASFEFKNTDVGWTPTRGMKKKWRKLGFSRCWICYTDKTEAHHSLW